MSLLPLVVAALTAAVSLLRWLRVSQREHYLPTAVVVTARRWLVCRPPNLVWALLWLALTAAVVARPGSADGIAVALGALAGVLGALFPLGMSVAGTPRLRPTRRAVFQAVIASMVTIGAVVSAQLALGSGAAAALAPAVAGLAVDVAARINRPVERRVAAGYRRRADEKLRRIQPRVVAVTGSYGKTTVKNHIRDLVGTTFDTLATPASWNNMAGLSRAVNEQLTPTTEVFLAEMGTYGPGEIREMAQWLRPEVAVITALGPVHLERMGSLEAIVAAKSEILPGARAAVICVDHPLLDQVAHEVAGARPSVELWRVGSDASRTDLDIVVCETPPSEQAEPGQPSLTVWRRGQHLVEVPRGSLHPSNVACATAAALALGIDRRMLVKALPQMTTAPSRSLAAVTDEGIVVVDDTFNSNPTGAGAALSTLTRLVTSGRRAVITPGMVELGPLQPEANQRFAEQVAASEADLVAVGWTNRRALLSGHPGAVVVRNREAARQWLKDNLAHGDGVLWENDLPDHYP